MEVEVVVDRLRVDLAGTGGRHCVGAIGKSQPSVLDCKADRLDCEPVASDKRRPVLEIHENHGVLAGDSCQAGPALARKQLEPRHGPAFCLRGMHPRPVIETRASSACHEEAAVEREVGVSPGDCNL